MPEQISKYPEVTLTVLEEAGAVCGKGAPQKILTECPKENFCSLRTGEICVYGIEDIPIMTQVTPQELAPIVCTKNQQDTESSTISLGYEAIVLLGTVFIAGLVLGRISKRFA